MYSKERYRRYIKISQCNQCGPFHSLTRMTARNTDLAGNFMTFKSPIYPDMWYLWTYVAYEAHTTLAATVWDSAKSDKMGLLDALSCAIYIKCNVGVIAFSNSSFLSRRVWLAQMPMNITVRKIGSSIAKHHKLRWFKTTANCTYVPLASLPVIRGLNRGLDPIILLIEYQLSKTLLNSMRVSPSPLKKERSLQLTGLRLL